MITIILGLARKKMSRLTNLVHFKKVAGEVGVHLRTALIVIDDEVHLRGGRGGGIKGGGDVT